MENIFLLDDISEVEVKFPHGEQPQLSNLRILYQDVDKMRIFSEKLVTCKREWNGDDEVADWTVVGRNLPQFGGEYSETQPNGRNLMHLKFKEPKEFLSSGYCKKKMT